jgi:hypothetical protein
MSVRVMMTVPEDRDRVARKTRLAWIARATPATMTATMAAAAGIEDRNETSAAIATAAAEMPTAEMTAAEMATAKSAGADAGEPATAEAAAETAEVTTAEATRFGCF